MQKGTNDSVAVYLRQLGPRRRLTREEEQVLGVRAQRGDKAAKDELARRNLAFVVSVAKKYANRGARFEDLIQEGNVGLMKAIEHYDPRKNVRFATYAVWWIRAYVTRYLKDNRSQVRGGESERGVMRDLSLDIPLDDGSDTTLLDRMEDPAPGPDDRVASQEQSEEVRRALVKARKRLGDLGWDILQQRLTQDSPVTLEEIGQRWGVSRERVRQVELKTKSFLARYLERFDSANADLGDDEPYSTAA